MRKGPIFSGRAVVLRFVLTQATQSRSIHHTGQVRRESGTTS
jgi:hypothetical protein